MLVKACQAKTKMGPFRLTQLKWGLQTMFKHLGMTSKVHNVFSTLICKDGFNPPPPSAILNEKTWSRDSHFTDLSYNKLYRPDIK